jgi:hypothetical protein
MRSLVVTWSDPMGMARYLNTGGLRELCRLACSGRIARPDCWMGRFGLCCIAD